MVSASTPATAAGAPPLPPWQVRWKRPQWECVQVGIEDPDHIASDGDDTSNLTTSQNENLTSDIDLLDPNWIPISSSSITLNRKEAYDAIMELQRRGKLLIQRMKKKAAIKQETDLTPLIDNAKTVSEQHDAPETSKVAKKSLTAPSSWFQYTKNAGGTITSTEKSYNDKSNPTRPPRASSSISPSSFSTFSNLMTPPRKGSSTAKNNEDNSNNNDDEEEDCDNNDDTMVISPPHNTDASTASSLLWEDRTLTSVSEEDAAAFRKKGKTKQNIIDHRHNHRSHQSNQATTSASSPVERKESLTRHDSDEDDWDGIDNVVLLVTIFSTDGSEEQGNKNISSGDVVVMELMSTSDPPLPQTNGDNDVLAGSDVTPTSRSKQQQQQRRRSSSLKVSTSSSSSLTTPSPPSLSQRSKATTGGGGSVTVESCSDSNVNMQQQQHPISDGEEEVETPSNHSRLLHEECCVGQHRSYHELQQIQIRGMDVQRLLLWVEQLCLMMNHPTVAIKEKDMIIARRSLIQNYTAK